MVSGVTARSLLRPVCLSSSITERRAFSAAEAALGAVLASTLRRPILALPDRICSARLSPPPTPELVRCAFSNGDACMRAEGVGEGVCGCGGGDSVQSLLTGPALRSSVGLLMDSTLGARVVVSCECCLEDELRRARSAEKVGGVPKRRRVGPAERALLLRSLQALCGAESPDAVSGLSECACSAAAGSQEALSATLSEYTAAFDLSERGLRFERMALA